VVDSVISLERSVGISKLELYKSLFTASQDTVIDYALPGQVEISGLHISRPELEQANPKNSLPRLPCRSTQEMGNGRFDLALDQNSSSARVFCQQSPVLSAVY